MRLSRKDENDVVPLYFGACSVRKHPVARVQDAIVREQLRDLKRIKFDDKTVYEATLAGDQDEAFGDALRKLGFERVISTKNPNSGNRINLYVRDTR